ncbi:hypothetical protein N7532_002250 [Penicillium argentinense]|uniref:Uncharacterized protein n=1 Tax=Penicillium argentinense TaxID=1131581 RepID=A0A9W9KKF5_9EURO|nr:uncharacterized protein N7532_002250 [Penicillium argentinense]KAJ5109605.1 hypothetical protein N7532_002250 [Penicillium argentinense]
MRCKPLFPRWCCLLISAQWEMVKGITFGYTVLLAFGFHYGGYGVMLMPYRGVVDAYGGKTAAG